MRMRALLSGALSAVSMAVAFRAVAENDAVKASILGACMTGMPTITRPLNTEAKVDFCTCLATMLAERDPEEKNLMVIARQGMKMEIATCYRRHVLFPAE